MRTRHGLYGLDPVGGIFWCPIIIGVLAIGGLIGQWGGVGSFTMIACSAGYLAFRLQRIDEELKKHGREQEQKEDEERDRREIEEMEREIEEDEREHERIVRGDDESS